MRPPFRCKNRHRHLDRIALAIAASHGMAYEYKEARRHGLSPIEALDDWDLLDDEALKKMNE